MSDDTLDPEQIRRLPVDRTRPLNGLTEAQTRALGLDPAEVEAGRLAQLEWEQAQQLTSDAQLVLAAREAVDNFDMTPAEAALALRQSGRQTAHDLFVREWYAAEQADDAEWEGEIAADELVAANASEYLQRIGQIDEATAAKAAEEAAAAKAAEDKKLADQIRAKLDSTVPESHPLRAGIEAAIVHQLTEDSAAARSEQGQTQLIRGAVQKTLVLDSAVESIRQQAEQEWRILRKEQGKTGALMTAADIEAAKAHYIDARMKQLGDTRLINHDDLKAPPTADDEKQKYVERFAGRNAQSTSLREAVSGIEARGRAAEEARRAGVPTYGSGSEKERYREAVRRAEVNARVGGEQPKAAQQDPRLPEGFVDEFGPAGYS